MTRLRNIFLGIAALILLVFICSLFFGRTFIVSRSVRVHAAPSAIFPYINSPARWDEWMAWGAPDSNYTYVYQGPPYGRYAKKIMKGPLVDITFKIQQSRKDSSIRYQIYTTDGEFSTDGDILIQPQGPGETEVIWIDSGDVGYNMFARFSLKSVTARQGQDMEQSLQRLKELAESK